MTDHVRTGRDAGQHYGRAARFTRAKSMMSDANRLLTTFYVGVALAALVGQTQAATEWLHALWFLAGAAVLLVELGGIALCAYADARRRLAERALAARTLSAVVAAGAVALNWFGHHNHLQGGFFAGLSALGYLVWLINSEARRRDQLRADGNLPDPPPAYELTQWIRHPWITRRAKFLAKADPNLGLYGSLTAAENAIRRDKRNAQLAKALRERITKAVDPTMANIAVLTYDLDEIADRLRASADYDGLTAILARELSATRLADVANVSLAPTQASAPALPGRPDADGLTSALPELTGVSATGDSPTDADGDAIPGAALEPWRVSPDASAPRQTGRDRVNGRQILASAHPTRPAPVTSSLTRAGTPVQRQPDPSAQRQHADRTAAQTASRPGDRVAANAEEARQRYRASVRDGAPLTGRQLGAVYQRSEAWGRERIREVKSADASALGDSGPQDDHRDA